MIGPQLSKDHPTAPAQTEAKSIAILLAAYNGEAFLDEQLQTLAAQSTPRIDLWVSDDGSSDSTLAMVKSAAKRWAKGTVHLLEGPGQGFSENFRSMLANPEIEGDYFAFCDQDDIWDEDKLSDALEWLSQQPENFPALFCSRTRTITDDGRIAGLSPLFRRKPSFRNAIVQSIAGGNTMVMNRAARSVLLESSRRTGFVSHDWWSYIIVTGVGGVVHYSPTARIGYRQHGDNLIGENDSWRARFKRVRNLVAGRFIDWNSRNLAGLAACEDMLTVEALETIRLFAKVRSNPSLFMRLSTLVHSGIYRQTLSGQIGLYVACLLRRL